MLRLMSVLRALCGLIGHNWQRHAEHNEPGTPSLVKCRRCGYVSSLEAERRKQAYNQDGLPSIDP